MKKHVWTTSLFSTLIVALFVSLTSFAPNASASSDLTVLPRDVSDVLEAGALWLPPADGERTSFAINLSNDTDQPIRLESARGDGLTVAPGETRLFETRRWDRVYYVVRVPGDPVPHLRNYHFKLR